MADTFELIMLVGSHRPGGGDNPITQVGMTVIPDLPANQEICRDPARGSALLVVKDDAVEGVQLNTRYRVTFEPLDD